MRRIGQWLLFEKKSKLWKWVNQAMDMSKKVPMKWMTWIWEREYDGNDVVHIVMSTMCVFASAQIIVVIFICFDKKFSEHTGVTIVCNGYCHSVCQTSLCDDVVHIVILCTTCVFASVQIILCAYLVYFYQAISLYLVMIIDWSVPGRDRHCWHFHLF